MDDLLSGLLDLPHGSQAPPTRELANRLRSLIVDGRLQPGQRLPSSRAMARSLGISRNSVSHVIEQLAAEGYLHTGHNRRPVVATGTSLAKGNHTSLTKPDRHAAAPQLSQWSKNLSRFAWPPVYAGRPRAFQPGLADEREFPHDIWGRCLRRAAANALRRSATGHNNLGLQSGLVDHLMEFRGITVRPEQILIVPSAQAAIALIAKTIVDPGQVAWMESPGYGGAFTALSSAGARVIGVPVDTDGMQIALGQATPRLIFVTPSHQYPTGRLMTVARRFELLQLANSIGATIIEDDYDGEFHYDGRPVAALAGLGLQDQIIYLGTFSKAMIADVRAGYMVVPAGMVSIFKRAQRHLGLLVPITLQIALADFMAAGHYRSHVRRMTRLYRARRNCLVAALAKDAAKHVLVDVPAGGMQLLARYTGPVSDVDLSNKLERAGVIARPLSEMLYHRSKDRGLFLGFAAWNDKEIEAGARVIGRILR